MTAMAELLALTTFLLVTAGIAYYGFRVYARPSRMLAQLAESSRRTAKLPGEGEQRRWLVRAADRIGEKIPVSETKAGMARRYLIAAGFRSENALRVLYGLKAVCCGVLLMIALALVH